MSSSLVLRIPSLLAGRVVKESQITLLLVKHDSHRTKSGLIISPLTEHPLGMSATRRKTQYRGARTLNPGGTEGGEQ